MNIKKFDTDFLEIVKDILELKEFQETMKIKHHGNGLYEHSLKTSYLAYRIAKKCGADYVCTARAGMLHDFFYFDWRSDEAKEKRKNYKGINKLKNMHGFKHPFEAYENSSRYFKISHKERDAIIKHMFPLVPIIPRYQESWIVTFADKIVATEEMLQETKVIIKKIAKKNKLIKEPKQ